MSEQHVIYLVDSFGSDGAKGVYRHKKVKFEAPYFKKKQMDDLYPAGGFKVLGQVGVRTKEEIAVVRCGPLREDGEGEEPVWELENQPHTEIKGYIRVGRDEYLAVVKDVVLFWLLWILLAALLLVLLGWGLRKALPAVGKRGEPETTTKPLELVDPNAQLGIPGLSIPDKIATRGRQIVVVGIPTIRLKANQREQTYVFQNPEQNPCYFKIVLELKDTHEVIYSSRLLPPGYSIAKFELKRPLEAGTYPVIVHHVTYSFDKEQRPLNNSDIVTTIVAE